MPALPYMQLYVAEYLADTAHLNATQHGAYLLLLMNYWQRGKALLNSNDRLANVARMSNDEWMSVRHVLAEFFTVTDEEWIHKRVEADLAKVAERSGKASEAGRASAAKRYGTPNKCSTGVQRDSNDRSTNVQPLRTEQNRTEQKQKPRVAAFVLPDWIDPQAWNAYEEMRNKKRSPMTDHARELAVQKLAGFKEKGHSPRSVLDNSTLNGWQGLFEPTRGKDEPARRVYVNA